jgi:pyruvate kinase
VANAILDGTDCVMLSGESAMGQYPVDAVSMLAQIATAVEPHRPRHRLKEALKTYGRDGNITLTDLISLSVETTLERTSPAAVIVPTRSGYTARMIARFKFPVWVTAVSRHERTCQGLAFSYGVYPVCQPEPPLDWKPFAREWVETHGLTGDLVVLTEGPSIRNEEANNRMELIDLSRG